MLYLKETRLTKLSNSIVESYCYRLKQYVYYNYILLY